MTPGPSRRRALARATPRLGAASLLLAGVGFVVGGLLHAHVPPALASRADVIAVDPLWVQAHWILTLAFPFSLPGFIAFALRHRRADGGNGVLAMGAILVGLGLVVGMLGTLTAATTARAAAESGDVALYEIAERGTLALGWLCIVITGAGATLVGAHIIARGAGTWEARITGGIILVGGAVFVVAAALLPPMHPWTHAYLLRYGAVLLGVIFAGLAVPLATRRHDAREASAGHEQGS